jgi:hypothetical protein
MKNIIIKILLKLIKVPQIKGAIDKEKEQEMFWMLYPNREFRNYIARRDLQILQILGEGVSREDYLSYLGQRMELQCLLRTAKQSFDAVDKKKK